MAKDTSATKSVTPVKKAKATKAKQPRPAPKALTAIGRPFAASGGYFVGAWRELRQVRWPNRRTTWGLTLAVLAFSAVLTLFIILLDLGFDWLSKRIIL